MFQLSNKYDMWRSSRRRVSNDKNNVESQKLSLKPLDDCIEDEYDCDTKVRSLKPLDVESQKLSLKSLDVKSQKLSLKSLDVCTEDERDTKVPSSAIRRFFQIWKKKKATKSVPKNSMEPDTSHSKSTFTALWSALVATKTASKSLEKECKKANITDIQKEIEGILQQINQTQKVFERSYCISDDSDEDLQAELDEIMSDCDEGLETELEELMSDGEKDI